MSTLPSGSSSRADPCEIFAEAVQLGPDGINRAKKIIPDPNHSHNSFEFQMRFGNRGPLTQTTNHPLLSAQARTLHALVGTEKMETKKMGQSPNSPWRKKING